MKPYIRCCIDKYYDYIIWYMYIILSVKVYNPLIWQHKNKLPSLQPKIRNIRNITKSFIEREKGKYGFKAALLLKIENWKSE